MAWWFMGVGAALLMLELLFRLLPVSTSTETAYNTDPLILNYPPYHRWTAATGWDLRNAQTDPHNLPVYAYHLTSFTYSHNHPALYVPKGFAHGFLALEDDTIFEYKVDAPYNKDMERSIHWQSFPIFDELLQKYNFEAHEINVSEKDSQAPYFDVWLKDNERVV